MRHYIIILTVICSFGCKRFDRIAFNDNIGAVKDSMFVMMKFMDVLEQQDDFPIYIYSRTDSTLFLNSQDIGNYLNIFADTLKVMNNVPYNIRIRFMKLIIFLEKNDIYWCGWDNIVGTWIFGYNRTETRDYDYDRLILCNMNAAIYKNMLEENNIIDEQEGLVLLKPDHAKFMKRRGPLHFEDRKKK